MPAPFPSRTFSGYIPLSSDKAIHYALVESERDPSNDPLLVWYSGGPGCSSMLGLFVDIGPFTLKDGQVHITPNPNSWNKKANVLFIDQPAGVGYSIARTPSALKSDDKISASDNLQTLLRFF